MNSRQCRRGSKGVEGILTLIDGHIDRDRDRHRIARICQTSETGYDNVIFPITKLFVPQNFAARCSNGMKNASSCRHER